MFPLTPRPRLPWQLTRHTLALGERTWLMGILNLTPDSFSDGGQDPSPEAAADRGLALLDDGADLLDLGAESTRPQADPVSPLEEQRRLLPVLTRLRHLRPDALLSVDTFHAGTAARALQAGADLINDVSGLTWDPAMPGTLAAARPHPGVILMHTRGTPRTWRDLPPLPPAQVAGLVGQELSARLHAAHTAGIPTDTIALDPGFGFGKRGDENFSLLADLASLHRLGRPLLIGLSRKGFLAGSPSASDTRAGTARSPERLHATLAAQTAALLAGAHLLRVHDVVAARAAAEAADRLLAAAASAQTTAPHAPGQER